MARGALLADAAALAAAACLTPAVPGAAAPAYGSACTFPGILSVPEAGVRLCWTAEPCPGVAALRRVLRATGVAVPVEGTVPCPGFTTEASSSPGGYTLATREPRGATGGGINLAGHVLTRAPRGSRGPAFVASFQLCPAEGGGVAYELADRRQAGGSRRGLRVVASS